LHVKYLGKLDRLSRSLRDVLTIMERLARARAGFRSLTEPIDTTTPAGRMMWQTVGAFAEFERAMLRNAPNPACKLPAEKGASAAARQSCPLTTDRDPADGLKRP
jgi:hypothetical protein